MQPILAAWIIRLELSYEKELSCYFTLIIFLEQHDEQIPSFVTRRIKLWIKPATQRGRDAKRLYAVTVGTGVGTSLIFSISQIL
jgi:hypothetical protein